MSPKRAKTGYSEQLNALKLKFQCNTLYTLYIFNELEKKETEFALTVTFKNYTSGHRHAS